MLAVDLRGSELSRAIKVIRTTETADHLYFNDPKLYYMLILA